jgi:hypothetical protein
MALTPYTRQANFASYEAGNPTSPKRAADLDAEFDAIASHSDATVDRLAMIQRDDGRLKNLSVHVDSLDAAVRTLFAAEAGVIRGEWVTFTAYAVKDVVTVSDAVYLCAVAHTSGTFAADLGTGKWLALSETAGSMSYIPDVTGGVETTVSAKLGESVSILDFMSDTNRADVLDRTELYDHSVEIQAACDYAIANGVALYAPSGTYNYGGANRLGPTLITDGSSLHIYGDGMGATIFKEMDGTTTDIGRFNRMWFISVPDNTTMNTLRMEHMTLHKNGSTSPPPDPVGDPYEYEQSHCVSVSVSTVNAAILNARFAHIEMLEKTGGGIVFGAGYVDQATVENCHSREWPEIGGQRGDIEFQATIRTLRVQGCTGYYVQCEPNATTPINIDDPLALFEDCYFETIDFAGYDDARTAQTVVFDRSTAWRNSVINSVIFKARNSTFGTDVNHHFFRTGPGTLIQDCDFVIGYDGDTDSLQPFYPRYDNTGAAETHMVLRRCRFRPGEGASITTTGYAIAASTTYDAVYPFSAVLEDCEFDELFQYSIDCYRNGVYVLRRCTLAGRDWAVHCGDTATHFGTLTLDDCNFDNVTAAANIRVTSTGTPTLTLQGTYDYSDLTWNVNSGFSTFETNFQPRALVLSDAAPTGAGIKGMRVRIRQPAVGSPAEYVCTVTHASAATWAPVSRVDLQGSKTFDWPDLATATTQSTTVTVTGAALGDFAEVSMSVALSGTRLWGEVTAADTVTVYHRNDTGGNINLASGTLRALVRKPS